MKVYPKSLDIMKLLIGIYLCVIIYACHGQESNGGIRNVVSPGEIEYKNPALQINQLNHQISQVVRIVFQDSRGDLWFGTQNGAYRYNGDSFIHIDRIQSESGKDVTIKDIAEDKYGRIWFGHTDGISRVDGELVTNYDESDGLINNDVWCITADVNGHIWIGTIDGPCVFNGREFTHFELPEGKIDSTLGVSSTKMIHSIMEDRKGTLWFSSNAGLFSYSNHKLIDVSDQVGIQTDFVNKLFEDKNGELWVSTKKGLYHLKENKVYNITADKIEVGKGIGSIAEDKEGNIWFVANQHDLYIYDGKKLSEYQKSEENKGPVIFQIYRDQDDRLWFVGYGGAYRLENGKFLNITKNGPW
jgi:ligand-binding sensor domain-containing protein